MTPEPNRLDLLGAEISVWIILAALAVALGAWLGTHRFLTNTKLSQWLRGWPFFGVRVALASVTFWLAWQTLGRMVSLETAWPLWVCGLIAGISIETIWWLYELEKRMVVPWRGRVLLSLRLAATVVVLIMLVQPVINRMKDREIDREVVVLVDDSESMHLADQQQTLADQLSIASLFEPSLVKDRPRLKPAQLKLTRLLSDLAQERSALDAPEGSDSSMMRGTLENRADRLNTLLDRLKKDAVETSAAIERAANQTRGIDGGTQGVLMDISRRLKDQFVRHGEEAANQLKAKNYDGVVIQLKSASGQLEYAIEKLPGNIAVLDDIFMRNLPGDVRDKIAKAAAQPRIEIARKVLTNPTEDGKNLFETLNERYNLRFVRFGRESAEFNGEKWIKGEEKLPEESQAMGFRAQTDLASALEETFEKVPADALAGVLLLSDGRHNVELPVEDAARQMGAQGSPLCALPIGSRIGPRDASVLNLTSPESIYLGDRIAIRSELKLDGLRGEKVKVRLMADGKEVDSEEIVVPDDQYRTEVRFMDAPKEKGIFDYKLQLDPVKGELFADNNEWNFKCAVSDDRTNVLLVDSVPRWEFRYLRNLFYGRDKSVHLQYVLLEPDQIQGVADTRKIYAAAGRKFGEAEATYLPENESEWRKFDAIILGDLPPASIDRSTWSIIRECVADRGAMVVFIAGRRYMPHAFDNDVFSSLLPVTYTPGVLSQGDPNESYRLELTAAGAANTILQQSLSRTANQQIWAGIPPMSWRFKPDSVKDGAEVLAYAMPEDGAEPVGDFSTAPGDVQAALEKLAHQKQYEQENALLVAQRFGLGRVVLLDFDSTWRFRYGVGDTYHHRFWGQMMRWGTGENLRSGGEYVRLGTDRLSYTPNEAVKVTAKVLDRNREPVTGGGVYVNVYKGKDRLQRRQMTYREGSNGIFETSLTPLATEGSYRLELDGGPVNRAMSESGLSAVETELLVAATRSAVELSELTADHDFLAQTAQLTGGAVAAVDDGGSLVNYFGAAKEVLKERHDIKLWDKWPLLLLFAGLMTTEWILRRRGGLA